MTCLTKLHPYLCILKVSLLYSILKVWYSMVSFNQIYTFLMIHEFWRSTTTDLHEWLVFMQWHCSDKQCLIVNCLTNIYCTPIIRNFLNFFQREVFKWHFGQCIVLKNILTLCFQRTSPIPGNEFIDVWKKSQHLCFTFNDLCIFGDEVLCYIILNAKIGLIQLGFED